MKYQPANGKPSEYVGNSKFEKLSSIFSFILIIFILMIIAKTPSANGYEISIYDGYPYYFWILIIITIILPFLVLIKTNNRPNIYTYMPFVGALTSLLILLSLPLFRMYPFYGEGDIHTHLGMIKDILSNGNIGPSNIYPITHILVAVLSSILNSKPETVSLYIRQFFVLVYILSIFILSKSLKLSVRESLFAMALAIVPVTGSWLTINYLMPSTEGFLIIPLVFFIFIKSKVSCNQFPYSATLVFFLILFPFFHPESSLFLLIILVVTIFTFKISVKQNFVILKDQFLLRTMDTWTSVVLLFVGFLAWFGSTKAFGLTVETVYSTLFLNLIPQSTPTVTLMNGITKYGFVEALRVIVLTYGNALTYIMSGATISLLVVINTFLRRTVSFSELLLSLLFIIISLINFLFLSTGMIVGFNIFRQLKYTILVSTILLGIYLNKLVSQKNKSFIQLMVSSLLVLALLFFTSILSVYTSYSSPQIYGLNYQPTDSDISGMSFFFNHRDENKTILEANIRSYQNRFVDFLLGYEAIKPNVRPGNTPDILPPPHFGYDSNKSLGSFYSTDQYLLIYPPAEDYYQRIYPKYKDLWRYIPEDFEMLNRDSSIDCVYVNGALKIILINGII